MTKQITILLGSMLLLTAAMVSAQTSQKVIVTGRSHSSPEATPYQPAITPLNSTVKSRQINGPYPESQSGKTGALMVLANNSLQAADPDKSYAIFQRYGSHYFLTEVWREGVGQTVAPGKLQRELAKQHSSGEVSQIEARLSAQ